MDLFPELGDAPLGPPRSVVYEPEAQRHLDEQAAVYERLPEIVQYIEWQLARFPENKYAAQMPFPNADTWLFQLGPYLSLGIPAIRILYQFDEETVTIWDVRISDD